MSPPWARLVGLPDGAGSSDGGGEGGCLQTEVELGSLQSGEGAMGHACGMAAGRLVTGDRAGHLARCGEPTGSTGAGLRAESYEEGGVICALRCCWGRPVWASEVGVLDTWSGPVFFILRLWGVRGRPAGRGLGCGRKGAVALASLGQDRGELGTGQLRGWFCFKVGGAQATDREVQGAPGAWWGARGPPAARWWSALRAWEARGLEG